MDDFRRRPVNRAVRPGASADSLHPRTPTPTARSAPKSLAPPAPPSDTLTSDQPIPAVGSPQPIDETAGLRAKQFGRPRKKRLSLVLALVASIIIATAGGLFIWYNAQLTPVDKGNTARQLVQIESGSTPTTIAELLHEEGLIRSVAAFLWYTRLEGVQNNLQAGAYRLSPSESTPEIVEHLSSGNVDTFEITFIPGETLANNRKVLLDAGYSEQEVDTALNKQYDSPLFAGKPASADLEGYIYGETYVFSTNTSAEAILEHTFEEFYRVLQEHKLVEAYAAQGLTLYEGITLASIIQKEAGSTPDDMAQISQVFHLRLDIDMPLGSDPTYQYAADKLGVPRDTNLDSPYNTRRYGGLPPGPIATPGEKALIATANPAKGDFLYFLSGDDDVTYFSRTFEEHERNIVNHCQKKCQIL